MLFLFCWLVLAGYLLNEGQEFWGHVVLWGGLVLGILLFVSSGKEKKGNGAGQQRQTAEEEDELEEMLYLLDDDED